MRPRVADAYVLARGGDALQELEVVVSLHAALLYSLAEHVKRCQVTRVGRVQNRNHHLSGSDGSDGRIESETRKGH